MTERVRVSEYLRWARGDHASIRFSLAASGMPALVLSDLGATEEDFAIEEHPGRAYGTLLDRLAAKHGVGVEQVVTAEGTSLANHLVLAALLEIDDEVLVEEPGYGPIVDTARFLGARVRRFPRRRENGFAIDLADVERAWSPRTRLIALTNLHNPSGALLDEASLREVGAWAARAGAHVLVDEVYLDAAFDERARSAIHVDGPFVVTTSLTKVYGLSGLRCGTILAQPELARKIDAQKDLYGVHSAHVAERLSALALRKLPQLAKRTRARLDANRPLLNAFLAHAPWLEATPLRHGTIAFPRLLRGSVDDLETLLHAKYATSVVPGRFFGTPDHFRVGITCPTPVLEEGLGRLGAALAEVAGA